MKREDISLFIFKIRLEQMGYVNIVFESKPVEWTVNNNIKMVGPYFECAKNNSVLVDISVTPSSVTVKVGIETDGGEKHI